ncbi:Fc.00g034570.m01.CDS01 [Cosmosporella sp. VM-42]
MPTAVLTPAAPPAVVGPKTKSATRPTDKLPQTLIDEARKVGRVTFDPEQHLNIVQPNKIYSMKEIGLEGAGISTTAASEPFSLFTPEAIKQMRAEIFSEPVLETCQYSSDFAKNMIRGFGPALAPFIFDAWHSPQVLDAVSKIAGIELVPALDFDVGHINVSINNVSTEVVQNKSDSYKQEDDMSAFAWHRDSYPFVCVTMLSDCTGMIGGETALRTGTGEVMKVRGPAMGTAVVMQGRYIEHQALKALGGRERISMVTSFRPKSALVKDETVLTGVRGISTLPELYSQYTQYRLEVLEERMRAASKMVRDRERSKRPFDTIGMRNFLNEQKQFMEAMLIELVE